MAQGSRQADPLLAHLLGLKRDPVSPAPNRDLAPGQSLGPIPIVAHADTTADLAPAQDPIDAALAVGPTVENAGAGATVAPPCPIAAGTSATALIQTQTAAWEYLA